LKITERRGISQINVQDVVILKRTTSQKVLFMAVIPEVLNRESILFRKLRAHGFPPSPTVGALSTGMTTFYEFTR